MAEDRTGVVARLDALEVAHKGATPGVWSVYWGDHIGSDVIQVEGGVRMRHEVVTLDDWRDQEDHEHPDDRTRDNPATEQDDAAAIVAEHNAFGELLAAVRGVLAMDDEKTTRDLARAWLRHQGYTDEWIAVGEQQTHQSAGCEFDTNCMTWMCCDSLDCSLHPEMDSVEEAGYFARFAVDFLAEQTRATVVAALGEA